MNKHLRDIADRAALRRMYERWGAASVSARMRELVSDVAAAADAEEPGFVVLHETEEDAMLTEAILSMAGLGVGGLRMVFARKGTDVAIERPRRVRSGT